MKVYMSVHIDHCNNSIEHAVTDLYGWCDVYSVYTYIASVNIVYAL